MADGDVKDYAGEKKKPSIALVISVGPKMPKKPEDTSTPDEAMKKAWEVMVEDNGTYEIFKNAMRSEGIGIGWIYTKTTPKHGIE